MQATGTQSDPSWRVLQAKAAGTSHLSHGLPCQDAVDWRLLPGDLLAIALADGAGTAPQAEAGANLAVAEALASLENSPANDFPDGPAGWDKALLGAFRSAQDALYAEAHNAGLPPGDFATTLTCLVASDRWVALGQVGDGAVIALGQDGALHALTRPQRGEYANETLFLTMPEALERAFFQGMELDLAGLAVLSDGLIRLALQLPGYLPYSPFFTPLWTFAARSETGAQANLRLAEFLASERVCARTDDDKSLVLAVLPNKDILSPILDNPDREGKAEG